ncbi:MAG: hypothetical protein ACM3UU_00030 [Ignavibacteriales bacterium]
MIDTSIICEGIANITEIKATFGSKKRAANRYQMVKIPTRTSGAKINLENKNKLTSANE